NQRAVTNDTYALVGQVHQTGNNQYYVRQYFSEFAYTLPAGQLPVAGHVFFRNSNTYGTNRARNLELREFDWSATGGSGVDINDWRTPAQLGALSLAGISYDIQQASSNQQLFMGLRAITSAFSSSTTKRYVLA